MARGFLISDGLHRDIKRTIQRVDGVPDGPGATKIPTRFEAMPASGGRLRLCKTTAAFNKSTVATLNVWEDGTPPNETQTSGATVEDVVNKYANIATGKFVSVARHGNGRWYVVAAECS